MLVWTCEICMKYVLLLSSPSSHTQLLLAFISMLVLNTYVFIMRVVMMCLLQQGRRPQRWKLVPHAPRVGLDTWHVLGRVVFAYVFEVNMLLVHFCAWWLITIDETVACTFIDENSFCPCLIYERLIIIACLILLILLIMIDVKLTLSGLWWTAYLFLWMGRRRAGLVDCISLVSARG